MSNGYPAQDEEWPTKWIRVGFLKWVKVYAEAQQVADLPRFWRVELDFICFMRKMRKHQPCAYRCKDLKPLLEGFSYNELED